MARDKYSNDPGVSEFTGDGQGPNPDPGVGVVPPGAISDLLSWYHTNPADPGSAPEANNANIGDDKIQRNRPKN
jgi:hypothetical protein